MQYSMDCEKRYERRGGLCALHVAAKYDKCEVSTGDMGRAHVRVGMLDVDVNDFPFSTFIMLTVDRTSVTRRFRRSQHPFVVSVHTIA